MGTQTCFLRPPLAPGGGGGGGSCHDEPTAADGVEFRAAVRALQGPHFFSASLPLVHTTPHALVHRLGRW